MRVVRTHRDTASEEMKQVNVRLPVSLIEKVRAKGQSAYRDFSNEVRYALAQHVAAHEPEPLQPGERDVVD